MNKLFLIILFICHVAVSESIDAILEPKVRKLLSTQSDGLLTKCLPKGMRINKGQVLLSQSTALIETEAEQIHLNIKSLKNDESFYRKLSQKKKDQFAEGIINQEEYEAAYYELSKVSNKINAYQLELKKILLKIEQAVIKADINGVVTKQLKHQGEFSRLGEVCIEVIDDSTLYAVFPYDSARLTQLKNKSIAVSISNKFYTARLHSISPEVDAASGLVQIKVALDNSKLGIRSGQKCIVHLHQENE